MFQIYLFMFKMLFYEKNVSDTRSEEICLCLLERE